MENRGNRRLHLRSSESNFGAWKHVYSLPSFLFFFFFYFLILVSLYIFGRAKTLQNRSFNIDTAGYKTIWSTDSLKIKKRHCEGNSPIFTNSPKCIQRYTHLYHSSSYLVPVWNNEKNIFPNETFTLSKTKESSNSNSLHLSFFRHEIIDLSRWLISPSTN